jgi:galactitol-specific phosphotransferase system IIB component
MKKIGVEFGLTNVADFLREEGYSVEILSESIDDNIPKLGELDAIVTSGMNTDMLGISDTETKSPVISAEGLTPQEIKSRIEGYIV